MTSPQKSSFNVVGGAISAVGILFVVLSMFVLDWVSVEGFKFDYSDLQDIADQPGAPGFTDAYFGWLGLVLLIAGALIALAANAGTSMSQLLGGLGTLVGLFGVFATLYGRKGDGEWGDIFDNAAIGLWAALVGFAVIAIGSMAAGMRRG